MWSFTSSRGKAFRVGLRDGSYPYGHSQGDGAHGNETQPVWCRDAARPCSEDGAPKIEPVKEGAIESYRASHQIEGENGNVEMINIAKANDATGALFPHLAGRRLRGGLDQGTARENPLLPEARSGFLGRPGV